MTDTLPPPVVDAPTRRASLARVCAILVVSGDAPTLPGVLATLADQDHRALDLVVVENGASADARAVLERRVPAERRVHLERVQGFGRAVKHALKHPLAAEADYVLLVHDDLALAPDAIGLLVAACEEDPELGIVGPKLRDWGAEPILQECGMTADRFGRAEHGFETGERDQGQHDTRSEVLYVSTAGMLVRPAVMRRLGAFDARYPAMRDDLDLCMRAWLLGSRVEVVPEAVGYHVAAGSRERRRFTAPARELAERHALAAMLKCYSGPRLARTLPVMGLLALAKVLGFIATRRVGDAAAVVRAYGWNLVQLPGTLRRRRYVQRRRVRSDREVAALLVPGLPRVHAYTEAFADWLAGGSTHTLLADDEETGSRPPDEGLEDEGGNLLAALGRHPVAVAAVVVGIAYLVGVLGFLGGGQLVGGEVRPWPSSALDFLRAYARPWQDDPLASGTIASPLQPLLGLLSLAGLGSSWLAQRLIVLGAVPMAFVTALRAGRLVTTQPAPRAIGATVYALSVPVLGALAGGLLGVSLAAALLPALVALGVRTATRVPPGPVDSRARADAWRAAALFTLGFVAAVAAAPRLWPLAAVGLIALTGGCLRAPGARARALVVLSASILLLAPWLRGVLVEGLGTGFAGTSVPLPLWRALAISPPVLEEAGGALLVATVATVAAVVVGALLLGLQARPGVVLGFVGSWLGFALLAWFVARLRLPGVWSPGFLLPAALAVAGLAMVAARWAAEGLRDYDFGARQLAVVVSLAVVTLGLGAQVVRLAAGPFDELRRAPELLPLFVSSDTDRVGPYRVLILRPEESGISFEVVRGTGPSMTEAGTVADARFAATLADDVSRALGGVDPRAAARLGVLGVRYVVVDGDATGVEPALDQQPSLQPMPSGEGRVYLVETWLPQASILPPDAADTLFATGDPGPTAEYQDQGLATVGTDVLGTRILPPEGGVLVLTEAASPEWHARSNARQLEATAPPASTVAGDTWAVNAFTVPAGSETVRVAATDLAHRLAVIAQGVVALLVLSLALRPPRLGRRRDRVVIEQALPAPLRHAAAQAESATGSGQVAATPAAGSAPPATTRAGDASTVTPATATPATATLGTATLGTADPDAGKPDAAPAPDASVPDASVPDASAPAARRIPTPHGATRMRR